MTIFLETERLIIKAPMLDDMDKIFLLDSDPEVMRYIGNGLPRSKIDSHRWFEKSVKHFEKYGFSFGLVFEKDTGEFVGRAGINYNAYDDSQPDIEIGYRLLKKFWKKGYATELATALIQWAFQNLSIDKLCGFALPDNKLSRRVLEKVGMRLIGIDKYADEEVVRYEIFKKDFLQKILMLDNKIYKHLSTNISALYGATGHEWLTQLPIIVNKVSQRWGLTDIIPVNNMTYHFVAYATKDNSQPVVLKVGCDKNALETEMSVLKYFDDTASVHFLDSDIDNGALLLHRAIPGISLKSLYPAHVDLVMDCYVKTLFKLHEKDNPTKDFPHVREWLAALDHVSKDKISVQLLESAIYLKNKLINTSTNEILLHGDLHLDNILQDKDEWIVIDPKGIIGEIEFEIAAFDFIRRSEIKHKDVKKILEDRIALIAEKSGLNSQRVKDWVFVRLILSAAWSIEDNSDPDWAINLAKLLCPNC